MVATRRVDSDGDVIGEGIKLGHRIFDHNVDVAVVGLRLSFCANCVFTAGRIKTLMAGSTVGWHGPEWQDEHIARGLGPTVKEALAREYHQSPGEWGEPPAPRTQAIRRSGSQMLLRSYRGHRRGRMSRSPPHPIRCAPVAFFRRFGMRRSARLDGNAPAEAAHELIPLCRHSLATTKGSYFTQFELGR